MLVFEDIEPARQAIREARRLGGKVGLVPTMGALHEGHLSLIRAARQRCSFVAVTIFVNPTQFAPQEDFHGYPRTWDSDRQACKAAGVDLLFHPRVETMYPAGAQSTVHVEEVTKGLCGPFRRGHFDGVATVCTKLFNILPADMAFFGEKDFQQVAVIRQMVKDLNIPLEIVACATVREPDGLAMSSRNAYLSESQRRQAASLSRALFEAESRIAAGERDVEAITAAIRGQIQAAGPVTIEYVDVVDPETLRPLRFIDRPVRICLAVRIGSCRLIDNVAVSA